MSSSSSNGLSSAGRNRYKNDFRDSGGLESQSVQELEHYAVYKAEETTKAVDGCLKIAEEMRDGAAKTLVALHQQGEQITRAHAAAADIDQKLSRGEKLLKSLGGMMSTWKPKKTRAIKGPIGSTGDDKSRNKNNPLQQREKLGLNSAPRERLRTQIPCAEPTNALQKIEVEKMKQDDGLSNLSNTLAELKNMAMSMSDELAGQDGAMDDFHVEVDEISGRTKGANLRARDLLRR